MEKFAPLNLSRDELTEYTREWKGERFPDGRPKVPDDILERMKRVTITQAWGVLGAPDTTGSTRETGIAFIPMRCW